MDHTLIDAAQISDLKRQLLISGIDVGALVATAWGSASTFRSSDRRGGANGGRIRLQPQLAHASEFSKVHAGPWSFAQALIEAPYVIPFGCNLCSRMQANTSKARVG